jgi:hypothetical protein
MYIVQFSWSVQAVRARVCVCVCVCVPAVCECVFVCVCACVCVCVFFIFMRVFLCQCIRAQASEEEIALQKRLDALNSKAQQLNLNRKAVEDVSMSIFKSIADLHTAGPPSDFAEDESPEMRSWLLKAKQATAPDTVIGGLIYMLLQRSSTSNDRFPFPPVLIHFALSLYSNSPHGFRLLRAHLPGLLPSGACVARLVTLYAWFFFVCCNNCCNQRFAIAEDTVLRHRAKLQPIDTNPDKYYARLVATADALGIPAAERQHGYLMADEVQIQVRSYCRQRDLILFCSRVVWQCLA